MGALDVSKVVHAHEGWRLITCIWLHGGLFHLLANMLSLLVIGIRLEQEFGFSKYINYNFLAVSLSMCMPCNLNGRGHKLLHCFLLTIFSFVSYGLRLVTLISNKIK